MDHFSFLDRLRENPADVAGWLVYADWLDEQDDPTGAFVRLSVAFTVGRIEGDPEDSAGRLDSLLRTAHPETRELLAGWRGALPLRFLATDHFMGGEDPPREMFGYARTFINGVILTGRVQVGTRVMSEDGTWRPRPPVQGVDLFAKTLPAAVAGREPHAVSLFLTGHWPVPRGTIIVEAPTAALAASG